MLEKYEKCYEKFYKKYAFFTFIEKKIVFLLFLFTYSFEAISDTPYIRV